MIAKIRPMFENKKYIVWVYPDGGWNVSIKGDKPPSGSYSHLKPILKLKGINFNGLVEVKWENRGELKC